MEANLKTGSHVPAAQAMQSSDRGSDSFEHAGSGKQSALASAKKNAVSPEARNAVNPVGENNRQLKKQTLNGILAFRFLAIEFFPISGKSLPILRKPLLVTPQVREGDSEKHAEASMEKPRSNAPVEQARVDCPNQTLTSPRHLQNAWKLLPNEHIPMEQKDASSKSRTPADPQNNLAFAMDLRQPVPKGYYGEYREKFFRQDPSSYHQKTSDEFSCSPVPASYSAVRSKEFDGKYSVKIILRCLMAMGMAILLIFMILGVMGRS